MVEPTKEDTPMTDTTAATSQTTITQTDEVDTPMDEESTSPSSSSPASTTPNITSPSATTTATGDDDEDDYIVTEVPVYLSQTLADNLFLFQYPLRQPWRPYDMNRLEELRIKPKQQKVEIDLSIDLESDFYNEQSELKTQMYTLSSTTVSHKTNYAVGILRNDEFHLTPLQSIIQLRPHFSVVDERYEEEKKEKKKDALENGEVDEEEEERAAAPVSYRKPTAKQMAANQPSFIKKMEDEEKWIKLSLVEDRLDENLDEHFSRLIAPTKDAIDFDLNKNQYIDVLCPKIPEEWVPKESHIQETVSLETIHLMTWQKQVKQILLNGHILPFSKIYQLLGNKNISEFDVVSELESIAILLKGRWIIKSNLVYKESNQIIARDYLVQLFLDDEYIGRNEFAEKTYQSSEQAREMISKIANVDLILRKWYLKQQPDEDFMTRFPHIVDNQTKSLVDQKDLILSSLNNITDPTKNPLLDIIARGIMKKDATPSSTMLPKGSNKQSNNNNNNNNNEPATPQQTIPEDHTVGTTVEQQLLFFIYNLLKNHGVCSIRFIKQRISQESENEMTNNLLKDFEEDDMIKSTLNLIADSAHYAYFLKSCGNSNIDKYRKVVIELFKKKLILSKQVISDACIKTLGEDIPAGMKSVIMNEFAIQKGTNWMYKSGK